MKYKCRSNNDRISVELCNQNRKDLILHLHINNNDRNVHIDLRDITFMDQLFFVNIMQTSF